MNNFITPIQGDCLEVMDTLIAAGVQVDAIITDPPYGTPACKWDSVIPFDEMWPRLDKIIKPNGAIVLFGSEPFSSALRMSNIKNYKYDWVWKKNRATGFLQAKLRPMRTYENIHVLTSSGKPVYNPQKTFGHAKTNSALGYGHSSTFGNCKPRKYTGGDTTRYPKNIIEFDCERGPHPTQKPVALMEYLIKTYTDEGEIVLDFTMGSGTTGVACKNTNRAFYGIEQEENYFKIALGRLNETI